MKYIKTIGLILIVVCIAVAVILCSRNERHIDANFDKKAIPLFLANEDAFLQVQKYMITLPSSIVIECDEDGFYAKDMNYDYVNIDENLNNSISQFFEKLYPMYIIYNAEDKTIKFELASVIQSKGIIYIGNNEKANDILKSSSSYQSTKDNWYYYEDMPGV